jgi:hypothetical protein
MNENAMLKPALIAGVLVGILSAVPPLSFFNCFCCAWVIGGGMLAAHLYVKNSPQVVKLGSGVALGGITGAIGGVVTTIFNIPVQILMNTIFANYASQARQVLSEIPTLPPSLREMILASGNSGFSLLAVIIAAILNIFIFGVIAMLGGVIGIAIFEKRKVELPGPPSTYIPPPPPPDYPEQ